MRLGEASVLVAPLGRERRDLVLGHIRVAALLMAHGCFFTGGRNNAGNRFDGERQRRRDKLGGCCQLHCNCVDKMRRARGHCVRAAGAAEGQPEMGERDVERREAQRMHHIRGHEADGHTESSICACEGSE